MVADFLLSFCRLLRLLFRLKNLDKRLRSGHESGHENGHDFFQQIMLGFYMYFPFIQLFEDSIFHMQHSPFV